MDYSVWLILFNNTVSLAGSMCHTLFSSKVTLILMAMGDSTKNYS